MKINKKKIKLNISHQWSNTILDLFKQVPFKEQKDDLANFKSLIGHN